MKEPRTPRSPQHALRVVVRFHDAIVEDRVFDDAREVTLGPDADPSTGVMLPPPHDGRALGTVRRTGPSSAVLAGPEGEGVALQAGGSLRVQPSPDVAVELTLVPRRRLPRDGWTLAADLAPAVLVLAMMVLGMQLDLLMKLFGGGRAGEATLEPTPELIARLLLKDFEGGDQALVERASMDEAERALRSFHLPAGARGPVTDPGGAAKAAPEQARVPQPMPEERASPAFQPLPPSPVADADDDPLEAVPALPGVSGPQVVQRVESADDAAEVAEVEPVPAEEKVGWGFQDWYDADDARIEKRVVQRQVERAEERLRIDPDDPWALSHLGYYQYLAEDFEGCERTYERFIELFPEDSAGYNNLALVYKRQGQYPKEEGYYRLALALDPDDTHAMNNLAVNLAHQGRFDEAWALMDDLAVRTPGDPYAELHRAKIRAAMGEEEEAYRLLELALAGAERLDTLHHIEFRQDIRVDPVFARMRQASRFHALLARYYGQAVPSTPGRVDG